METWITPPAHFVRDETKPQAWKAEDKNELLNPMLRFGRKPPLRPNLRVMREQVELPTDIDILVSQYCRTLGARFSSPENYDVTVSDIVFDDKYEGRMLNIVFPDTSGLFPIQTMAFRLDEDQLTTAIYTTEKSLLSQKDMGEIGVALRTLRAP